ncbi:MAG: TetR/AcrR family transcriptional regulator [Myxococcota bacterium]
MRYPDGHKERVRERIVHEASRIIRAEGLDALSVGGVMRCVGLTHGGFYAHFANKDELIAEAIRAAGQQTQESLFEAHEDLGSVLERYLCATHAAHPEEGCVIAALGTQAAGRPQPIQSAFDYTTRGLIDLVHAKLEDTSDSGDEVPSREALATTARMVGGVILSRLVEDPGLAQRILCAARS